MAFLNCWKLLVCRFPPVSFRTLTSKLSTVRNQNTEVKRGLIVGMFTQGTRDASLFLLTPAAETFNKKIGGKLRENILNQGKKVFMSDGYQLLHNLDSDYDSVALVDLGKKHEHDEGAEYDPYRAFTIKTAAGLGTRALCKQGMNHILVESMGNAKYAAEGAYMAAFRYQMRVLGEIVQQPSLELYLEDDTSGWEIGLRIAEAQSSTLHMFNNLITMYKDLGPTSADQKEENLDCKRES